MLTHAQFFREALLPITPTEWDSESLNPFSETTSVISKTENRYEEGCTRGGGQHFGWPGKEGSVLFPSFNPDPDINNNGNGDIADANGWADPIFDYDHEDGADIIGGFVYRGTRLPELHGKYVFADHQGSRDPAEPIPNVARLFYGDLTTGEIFQFNTSGLGTALPARIFSIGQDSLGELFVLGLGGVFAIVPVMGGDYNHDGVINSADYVVWRDRLGHSALPNETASLGKVDQADYELWRQHFGEELSGTAEDVPHSVVPEPDALRLVLSILAFWTIARFRFCTSNRG